MPGAVDSLCPACEKTIVSSPRGMGACGHIVCEPCLRSTVKKHSHGVGAMMVHALGASGLVVAVDVHRTSAHLHSAWARSPAVSAVQVKEYTRRDHGDAGVGTLAVGKALTI